MASPYPPVSACILSVLGGSLIGLEGVLFLAGWGFYVPPVLPGPAISPGGLGGMAVGVAVAVVLLSFLLLFWPQAHVTVGIGIVTFGLLSLPLGGGFFLGAMVAWVGGVLAILYVPRLVANPTTVIEEEPFVDPVEEADLIDAGQVVPLPEPPGSEASPPPT